MKKQLFGFFILLSITASQFLNPKLIVGEWQLTDFTFQSLIESEEKTSWENNIEKLKETSVFTFTDEKGVGKRYEITLNERSEEGAWDVSEDQRFLVTQSNTGSREDLEILEISETKMVLQGVIASDTIQMTFQKIN